MTALGDGMDGPRCDATGVERPTGLTHVDAAGRVHMVDVGAKSVTARLARAEAFVACSAEALRQLATGALAKGDGLAVARVAGIMAAKRTADLIPLAHPLPIDAVSVELALEPGGVRIEARVRTTARTGVEMEALTACAVAGLAVVDMVKAVDRGVRVEGLRVIEKSGGASGSWAAGGGGLARREALPKAGVVTVSDRASAGEYEDVSGPTLAAALRRAGAEDVATRLVPDEIAAIRAAVEELVGEGCRIVLTTGGTGIGPRDRTPEALAGLFDYEVPGLAEGLRAVGARRVASAALSRGVAGVVRVGEPVVGRADSPSESAVDRRRQAARGGVGTATASQASGATPTFPPPDGVARAFVAALPGSPDAVADAMAFLAPLLGHIADQLAGGGHRHVPPGGPTPLSSDPRLVWATVGEGALDPAALEASVRRRAAGAVVTFSGVVRDQDGGRAVASLEYSAHPDAEGMLARLAVEQLAAHPAVQAMAVGHRVGPLEVGDVAFAAACSAAHRADAFAACADLVDAVKAGLPVWKRQHFDNGDDEWVGL